jgi:DNA-binding XRE family transcriptional regulator
MASNKKVNDLLEEFARKTKLSRLTYHNIENGSTAAIKKTQIAIAKPLGFKSYQLFDKNGMAKTVKKKHIVRFVKIVNEAKKE